MTIKEWIEDTREHQSDVYQTMVEVFGNYLPKAINHDEDKIEWVRKNFAGVGRNTDIPDLLDLWKATGFMQHKIESHHHKENVSNLFEVLEMLVDWACACRKRRGNAIDPDATRYPNLDWDAIMRNTLELIATTFDDMLVQLKSPNQDDKA